MTDFKFYPMTAIWEITFACNMRCLHCGTSAGKKRPDELTTAEALHLIDELADLGCDYITLSGGEPLIRPDWRELTEKINSRGIKPYMVTNGYAITPEIVADFEGLGFKDVGVSLDGTEKTHNYIRQRDDSWRKATGAMRMMTANGKIPYCAVSQISNINLDELEQIRQILVDLGCRLWRIQLTTATGRMQEYKELVLSLDNYPRLLDKLIEMRQRGGITIDVGENIGYYGCKGYQLQEDMPYLGCYAGMRAVGIESNGNIKGCLSMPEEFIEGNIRDSSFTAIWNSPTAFAYNRQFTRETADGFCYDCRYLPLCRGGCATTSVSASGKRADNPYCAYRIEQRQGVACHDPDLVTELLSRFQ